MVDTLSAASYERVSSDEQAREGFSLEVQGEKNVSHIVAQGWKLHDRYIDPGKSAKNLKRPDMQRLLEDINKGLVQVVVVHKLDRLTRNIGDLHELLMLFDRQSIKLVSINENIDTSSAMGRMFVYMLGIFAQWYRENLSEEVIKGQRKRAEKGLRNSSSRPYGYNVNPEDLSLYINEDEAPIVRQVFDRFLSGWGKVKIAQVMNEEGIPAMGGGKWYESVIIDMLSNPSYAGSTHWKAAMDEEAIIVEDVHEPIISKEMWKEALKVAERRKEGWISSSSYDFPFSTLVKCGECGRSYHGKMVSRKVKAWETPNYRCSGKYRAEGCGSRQISELKLEKLFFDFLSNFRHEAIQPDKKLEGKDAEKEIKRLKKLLSESETKRKNYARAMGNGKLDYDLFEELVDEENAKCKVWSGELEQLEVDVPSARTVKDVVQQIQQLKSRWPDLSRADRKLAVSRLFDVIIIKYVDDEWKVTGYKLA